MKAIEKTNRHLIIIAEALPEDQPIKGNAVATGNEQTDNEICEAIQKDLDNGNDWAWCVVRVHVIYKGVQSDYQYLGGCSYKSMRDFIDNGGSYYTDMVNDAIVDLNERLQNIMEDLI